MDEANDILDYLQKHHECFDRFTFDNTMRFLLQQGCDQEEAKDLILAHCALSALTFQQRIYNEYYLKINLEENIAADLKMRIKEVGNEEFNQSLKKVTAGIRRRQWHSKSKL